MWARRDVYGCMCDVRGRACGDELVDKNTIRNETLNMDVCACAYVEVNVDVRV